jgi:hypothetical protein
MLSSSCSGQCPKGYYCPEGTVSATSNPCPIGRFGAASGASSALSCELCAVGRFGNTSGLPSPNCTGLCASGYYGSTQGLNVSTCTGRCSAGYYCPAGSTNKTAVICPAGQFSVSGASSCTNCGFGFYGNTTGLTTQSCSGKCPAGSHFSDTFRSLAASLDLIIGTALCSCLLSCRSVRGHEWHGVLQLHSTVSRRVQVS